jgi:hypothetical protein
MSDKKITVISETKDLGQRVLEVNATLSRWLKSKGHNYNCEKDMLRLSKINKTRNSYIYQYEILTGVNTNCILPQHNDLYEKDTKVQEWVLRQIDMQDMAIGA